MLRLATSLAFALIASTVFAQVSPNGYVTNSYFALGGSTTFVRDGSTANAFAWTEATLWNPDSSYTVLGNDYSGLPFSQSVTPSKGPGTYWIQYRLVDEFYNYEDQWISFTVYQPNRAPYVSGYGYAYQYTSHGTWYHLTSTATDADANLSEHYFSKYSPYGSPLGYWWTASGDYSYNSYDLFVPEGEAVWIYYVAIDSYGAIDYFADVFWGYSY